MFPGPYRVPRASFTAKAIYTNTVGRTAYRGPWQFESLAREVLLDIAARQMGIDPAELRRRNLLRQDEMPYTNANGMPFDNISPLETFEQALEMLDYEAFRAEQAEAREQGPLPRRGHVATSSRRARLRLLRHRGATIRIEPSGKVNVYIAGGSTGNSIETTVVQLTADALGVDIEDVPYDSGRHRGHRFGAGAAGSRSGSMTAGAIRETAAILRDRIVAIAAHKLEAPSEDIELANGRASVRGTPTIGMSFAEVARSPTSSPRRCRPACRPDWRRAPATRPRPASSGSTPRTCARAKSTSPPVRSGCCATS
jgi:carbon-monoxide dehydrogenase large subunit